MDNRSSKLLAEWIAMSNKTQFLVAENTEEEENLLNKLQLTESSVLGCLIKDLGYVICGNHHIRILGGKNPHCKSFFEVNTLYTGAGLLQGILVVADTLNGGLFALNCDKNTGAALGEMLYLPYGSLIWERLDIGYSDFVRWAINASPETLVSGGWVDSNSKNVPFNVRDQITQSKLDILLSIRK